MIDVGDDISFKIENIKDIRLKDEYSGYNVNLKANFDGLKTNLMVDVTTGDVITYKEVKYKYRTLFDDDIIEIMSYNYETIIAEKFETIIFRNVDNTRMKDYYDLYMFVNLKWDEINKQELREAVFNTSRKRKTESFIINAYKYIKSIEEDITLQQLWDNYSKNYEYAKNVSFEDTINAIKRIDKIINLDE